jgi:hypothetical protein
MLRSKWPIMATLLEMSPIALPGSAATLAKDPLVVDTYLGKSRTPLYAAREDSAQQ